MPISIIATINLFQLSQQSATKKLLKSHMIHVKHISGHLSQTPVALIGFCDRVGEGFSVVKGIYREAKL